MAAGRLKASNDRNLGIDALRGAAALAVLVYHAREILWIGLTETLRRAGTPWDWDAWLGAASLPFRWGHLGVPLFFVISGYCIHRPHVRRLARDPSYRFPLGNYLARRVWRIYPVLMAALVLTAACDAVTRQLVPDDPILGDNSWYSAGITLASLQNFVLPPYGSNGPLWTLSMELHFYLAYPLAFGGMRRLGAPATTAATLLVSVACWALGAAGYLPWALFLPFWFSWMAGAYVAEAEAGRAAWPRLTMLAAALPCLAVGMGAEYWARWVPLAAPLAYAVLAVPFSLVVWWAVTQTSWALWSSNLSRWLAAVGVFSYSLYATHKPLLVAYRAVVHDGEKSEYFLAIVPGMVLAVTVGWVTFMVVEKWSLALPGSRSQRQKAQDAGAAPVGEVTPRSAEGSA